MRKHERVALALLAFAAWQAYCARVASEQALVLAMSEGDFDPLSWQDWKKRVRDVTISNVIEKSARFAIRRLL